MYYLYVKIHNVTKMKYLGITKKNPLVYKGSGKLWKKHLKEFGNDIETHIIFESENKKELCNFARNFSKINNIVESEEWFNLIPETGGGTGKRVYNISEETKKRMSESAKKRIDLYGESNPAKRKEVREKISQNLKKYCGENHFMYGQHHTEETKKRMSESAKNYKKTNEHCKNISLGLKTKFKNLQCPHCNKIGSGTNMKRYHFDNCKMKTSPFCGKVPSL